MVPVSGSAYTYSYVAFGELIAWIIGWALIMEYAIGNITVAISWSDYFTGLLDSGGIHLPQWIQMDYLTASKGFHQATALMQSGKTFENLDASVQAASHSLGKFSNNWFLSFNCRFTCINDYRIHYMVGL